MQSPIRELNNSIYNPHVALIMTHIDHLILLSFLVLILVLGIFAGRYAKSFEDYALANRSFNAPLLLVTLSTTLLGGAGVINEVSTFYCFGYIYILISICGVLSNAVLSLWVIPLFDERFRNMISLGDILGFFYGPKVELLTSSALYVFSLGTVAILFSLGAQLCVAMIEVEYMGGLVLIAAVVIAYSAMGGIKAVILTDVVQFVIMMVVVSIFTMVILNQAGGLGLILAGHFSGSNSAILHNINELQGVGATIVCFSILALPLNIIQPPIVQRFLMVYDPRQLAYASAAHTIFKCAMLLMITCIGLGTLQLYPGVSPKEAASNLMQDFLPTPFRGVAICSLLSVLMATADSFISGASILLVRNILPSSKISAPWFNDIKLWTWVSGVLAALIAMCKPNIVTVLVLQEIALMPLVAVPLLFGLLRFKVHEKEFWIVNCLTLPLCLLLYYLMISEYYIALISMTVAVSAFGLAHFCNHNCFVRINGLSSHPQDMRYPLSAIAANLGGYPHNLKKALWGKLAKMHLHIQQHPNHYSWRYRTFGLFMALNYLLPWFMWSYQPQSCYIALIGMRVIGGVLCLGLVFHNHWPLQLKRTFLGLYWYFTVLYCLPFMISMLIVMSGLTSELLINMTLSIIIMTMVIEPLAFLIITSIGATSAITIYFLAFENFNWYWTFEGCYMAIYTLVFSTAIGLLFACRPKVIAEQVCKAPPHVLCSMKQCITNALRDYQYIADTKLIVSNVLTQDIPFYGIAEYMQHTILYLLKCLGTSNNNTSKIEVYSKNNTLYIKNYTTATKAEISAISSQFWDNFDKPPMDLDLAFCHLVMKSLGATLSCDAVLGQYIGFILVFPVIGEGKI